MMAEFTRCDLCRVRLRAFGPANGQDQLTCLLPCLHAVCPVCHSKCLQGPLNQHTILCQICRTECSKNYVLALPDGRECVTRRCESAACPDKQRATMKCMNCNEALCAICSQAHRRVTATCNHILQAIENIVPDHARCSTHNQMRIVYLCSCGIGICNECLMSHMHEGPAHVTTPIMQLAPASRVEEAKITSSTAREASHIECSLSMIQVRKTALDECVGNLKKEVGNHVVQICQSVMRRGNDLLRALDTVQQLKTREYDKLREELNWQQMRFDRINAYVAHIKHFEEPTALVMTKQFLENCIKVIKTKKVNNERGLNGLQRPPQVQFKPTTDHLLGVINQWGRILADLHEGGSLKPVDVPPTPPTSNPIDVPLFDLSKNGMRGPMQFAAMPSTSYQGQPPRPLVPTVPGAMRPGAPPLRAPITQEQARLIHHQHQQQLRAAHEMSMRHATQVVRKPTPADPRYVFPAQMRPASVAACQPNVATSMSSMSSMSSMTPMSSINSLSYRFGNPSCSYPMPVVPAVEPRFSTSQFMFPNRQMVSYPPSRVMAPTVPNVHNPYPASNLMEALNGIHRMPIISGPASMSPPSSCAVLAAGSVSPPVSRVSHVEGEKKKASDQEATESRRVHEVPEASDHPGNANESPAVHSSAIFAATSPDSTTQSVAQKPSEEPSCSGTECAATASTSSPPPKDPEPASLRTPLKVTIRRNTVSGATSSLVSDPEQNSPAQRTGETGADVSTWDDYCYVCQQGCDDKTGSLGCCVKCPRVYHNHCHIPAIKQPMESLPDEWACSLCVSAEPLTEDTGVMGTRERILCSKVLLCCFQGHLEAEPFRNAVPKTVPNYYVIIKQPMDFSTVARRLKERSKEAFTNVSQFIFCMNLVFENCSTFNPPDDDIAKAGKNVYLLYNKAVKDYLPCMRNQMWLYINKYSEGRNNMLVQKDSNSQLAGLPRGREPSAEPAAKKPRKEIKTELDS